MQHRAIPRRRGQRPLATALACGACLLAFLVIPFLANHGPEARKAVPANTPAPPALLPDPLQSDLGSGTQDDYFLRVAWETRDGRFPFSHRDRLASIDELKRISSTYDELVKTGALTPGDEAPADRFIYGSLFAANRTRADHMAGQFRRMAEWNRMDAFELAREVIRCVQKIPYAIPDEISPNHDLGIFTPNEVAYFGTGDCDTKSLFAAILLTRLGYRCVLFGSDYYGHCMLGIETGGAGEDTTDLDGHRYGWVEMTAYDSPIGLRPADCYDPSKWVATPLE